MKFISLYCFENFEEAMSKIGEDDAYEKAMKHAVRTQQWKNIEDDFEWYQFAATYNLPLSASDPDIKKWKNVLSLNVQLQNWNFWNRVPKYVYRFNGVSWQGYPWKLTHEMQVLEPAFYCEMDAPAKPDDIPYPWGFYYLDEHPDLWETNAEHLAENMVKYSKYCMKCETFLFCVNPHK